MATRMSAVALLLLLVASCGGGGGGTPSDAEVCDDGTDNDADGLTDCDDDECAGDTACLPVVELCSDGTDNEGDGFADCDDDDCWEDPACYKVDDDVDLPGPDGDPSLDLDKVGVKLVNGTATFFATMEGPWPPPTTAYSWFVYFEIDNDGNTPVAGVTVQRQNGVDATIPTGIPAGNITIRQTARGIWARLTGVPATGVNYYVESGVQLTSTGTRVTDTAVSAPAPLP